MRLFSNTKKINSFITHFICLFILQINQLRICRDMWDAAEKGYLSALKFYYKKNPSKINDPRASSYNHTPLHIGVINCHIEIVKFLIFKTAEIDKRDSLGRTPLMYASEMGFLDIMKFLLNNNAFIKYKNSKNETALHRAIQGHQEEAVLLLFHRDANRDFQRYDSCSPIQFAKNMGNRISIIKILSQPRPDNDD